MVLRIDGCDLEPHDLDGLFEREMAQRLATGRPLDGDLHQAQVGKLGLEAVNLIQQFVQQRDGAMQPSCGTSSAPAEASLSVITHGC
jgi:hypothetical protein